MESVALRSRDEIDWMEAELTLKMLSEVCDDPEMIPRFHELRNRICE